MRESPCRYTMIVAGASYLKLFLLSKHYSGTGRNVEFQPLFLFFTVQRIGNSKVHYRIICQTVSSKCNVVRIQYYFISSRSYQESIVGK